MPLKIASFVLVSLRTILLSYQLYHIADSGEVPDV